MLLASRLHLSAPCRRLRPRRLRRESLREGDPAVLADHAEQPAVTLADHTLAAGTNKAINALCHLAPLCIGLVSMLGATSNGVQGRAYRGTLVHTPQGEVMG